MMQIVRLYATDIVEWDDDFIKLNTGGYKTTTTFRSMNKEGAYLGFQVSMNKGRPYVKFKGHIIEFSETITLDRSIPDYVEPAISKSKLCKKLQKRKSKSGTNNNGTSSPS